MARGPEITDEVRMLIAKLHKQHPKWTNKKIRNEVSKAMREKNPSSSKSWPSKFAIDRIMPGIRERAKRSRIEPNPLDKPWTAHSMSIPEYHIPPEALPAVLRLWYFFQDRYHISLTIREARWAARLYAAVTDTGNLAGHTRLMAISERMAEEAGLANYMGGELDNLHLYSTMTGHAITREEVKRITGWSEEQWRQMKEAWPRIKQAIRKPQEGAELLDPGTRYERPTILDLAEPNELAEEPNKQEVPNERKPKRIKNERRHKKAR